MKHSPASIRRCGTNYLFLVMAVSIVFFALVGWNESFWLRLLSRSSVPGPLVAGISYEVLKLAAKVRKHIHKENPGAPGMALQYITSQGAYGGHAGGGHSLLQPCHVRAKGRHGGW